MAAMLKECETIELKKSTSELKEAIISISAMLNKHQKGEIYFGVKNNGTIVGQPITGNTTREISKAIADNIEPKIFPKINEMMLSSKNCIHVEFAGENIPYFAYGRAYVRVGDEDRKISAKELERLILLKNKEKLQWDKEICSDAKLADIKLSFVYSVTFNQRKCGRIAFYCPILNSHCNLVNET